MAGLTPEPGWRQLDELKCSECGQWLVNAAGGEWATCPAMHGKLPPLLSKQELRLIEAEKLKAAAPVATREGKGPYSIDGRKHRKVRHVPVTRAIREHATGMLLVARVDDHPLGWVLLEPDPLPTPAERAAAGKAAKQIAKALAAEPAGS